MSQYEAWWKREKMLPGGQLPKKLQTLLDNEDPAFIDEICSYAYYEYSERFYRYQQEKKLSYDWLWNLSLHPSPLAKKALVKLLSRYNLEDYYKITRESSSYGYYLYPYYLNGRHDLIPIEREHSCGDGTLHIIKAIYKRAEEMQDEEIWSVIAYRFDIGKNHLYSKKTRHYMRRRAWRYLRRLGEKGSSAYVRFATNVLLHYDDLDGRWKHFDLQKRVRSFTHLWLFNHLLYHNSKRFTYPSSQYWQDQGIDSYPERLPEEREEAFPELWDQHPERLFQLLMKAKAKPVLQFASRALRMGNPHYVSQKKLLELLDANHPIQRSFAAASLLDRMKVDQPDFDLLLSFLFSNYPEVRLEAKYFIAKHQDQWALERLRQLISEIYERMNREQQPRYVIAYDLVELFQGPLKETIAQLATIEMAKQFLASPLEPFQKFSAYILSAINLDRSPFTGEELLPFLLHSQPEIREAAQKRLENELDRLLSDGKWLVNYVTEANEESHAFIVDLFQRYRTQLLPLWPQLRTGLWSYLLQSDGSEAVQELIVHRLFRELFFEEMLQTPMDKILLLLEHQNSKVQEFAAQLFEHQQLNPREFKFEPLLSMAHHRVAAVRQLAREMIMKVEDRITVDWIVNLIETDWDDTREWMMAYIQSLPAARITPELVYGLLDTARLDIQTFTKKLVEQHAASLDMKELMLRGSEHPDLAVQEYVLSLAEKIKWDPKTLKKMELFFRIVLLRVHQGRKAKNMALALLVRLGEEKLAYARIVAPILADVARNQGVKDFETILAALTRLQLRFPACSTPIEIA